MTKYEAAYLQALRDMQDAVRVFIGETTSPDGKLELLGVLSLISNFIDANTARHGGETTADPANENAEARND